MKLQQTLNNKIDALSEEYKNNPDEDKILIIRTDGIGDFFIFIKSLITIRKLYKNKKIGILASEEIVDYVLEKKLCDYGIKFSHKKYQFNIIYRHLKNLQLLHENIYKVINPIFSRTSTIDNLVKSTKAPVKIGIKGCYANQTKEEQENLNYIYTSLFKLDTTYINESIRNKIFLEYLGIYQEEIVTLNKNYNEKNNGILVIGPCAGRKYRQWGEVKYIELIKKINEIKNYKIILVGSKKDRKSCKKIIQHLDGYIKVSDQSGKLTLLQLEELIKTADLVISGETSLTHIAAYIGTKSICIAGGGHFGRFIPYVGENKDETLNPVVVNEPMSCYGCNWNCTVRKSDRLNPMPCIENISTEKVFSVIEKLINGLSYE